MEESTINNFKKVVSSVFDIELSDVAAKSILMYADKLRLSKGDFKVSDAALIAVKNHIEKIQDLVDISSAHASILLTDLSLSKRALNALHTVNAFTVEDLKSLSIKSLRWGVPGCGKRTLGEIEMLLWEYDIPY